MMNRREMLGSAGAVALLPVLPTSGAATGSSTPPVFEGLLCLGPATGGAGNHRWARILDGTMNDEQLVGRVTSGRLDWLVDPCSGAVEASVRCQVQCADGVVRELARRGLKAAAAGDGKVRLIAVAV